MSTRTELGEGPAIVERLLDVAVGPIDEVARAVRARTIDLVVIAARGTSDHAAIYAQYILGARNRLPVALAAPVAGVALRDFTSPAQRARPGDLAVRSLAGRRGRLG